ncbi:MAG: chromate transporter [Culicoidibacterales bacterium]
MNSFFQFLVASFLSGIVTFGGGVAFVPVMHGYYVTDYQLISDAAYSKLYVYATSTPGPIAPLITGYIGYTQFGFIGMILGIMILILPTTGVALILYPYFEKHQEHPILAKVDQYIRPLLIILFIILLGMQVQLLKSEFSYYWLHFLIIAAGSLFFLVIKKVKVIYIVVSIITYAIFMM